MSLKYLDIVLVVLVGVPAVALGAPELGYAVGAGAWTLQRLAAVAIMVVGLTATRADGLTAALVIFAAFSFTFARTAFAHVTRTRSNEPGAASR